MAERDIRWPLLRLDDFPCLCGHTWHFHSTNDGSCSICNCPGYDGPQPLTGQRVLVVDNNIQRIYTVYGELLKEQELRVFLGNPRDTLVEVHDQLVALLSTLEDDTQLKLAIIKLERVIEWEDS